MRASWTVPLLTGLLLSCAVLGGAQRPPVLTGDKPSKLVFEDRERHVMLIVDEDGNLRLFSEPHFKRMTTESGAQNGLFLGQEVVRSGNLALSKYVHQNEVAFQARRLTLASGVKLHIVFTWGPMQEVLIKREFDYRFSPVVRYLYVLREVGGDVNEELREDHGALFRKPFGELIVDDINNDGQPDIVSTGMSWPRGHWMKIWTITKEGHLRTLHFAGETLSPQLLCTDMRKACEIRAERHEGVPGGTMKTYLFFRWDSEKQEYHQFRQAKERITIIEETN